MPCWVPYRRLDSRDCGGASVPVGEVGVSGAGIGGMLCRLSGDHRKTEQVTFPRFADPARSQYSSLGTRPPHKGHGRTSGPETRGTCRAPLPARPAIDEEGLS
jgi:hypothetical protein